jgi:hypothetical protein
MKVGVLSSRTAGEAAGTARRPGGSTVSTCDLYTTAVDRGTWDVPTSGAARQRAFTDLGVLEAADSDLEVLMGEDEDIAERVEREHAAEFGARQAEVDAAIGAGED